MPVTVWKGQLTFGLVSIPIRIVRAARQERIRFTHVYRAEPAGRKGHPGNLAENEAEDELVDEPPHINDPRINEKLRAMPIEAARLAPASSRASSREQAVPPARVERVQHQYTAADTGEAVAARDVLKGYEYEKDRFAVFRPEEMRRFRAETTRDMEIIEFVKLEGIDPVYFNASYYVAPDRGGDKPYSLLFEAMRRSGYAALARFAMHGREQIVALRHGKRGIVMHTLFFQTEVHAEDEFSANSSVVTPQEMKLAELLVSQLAAQFDASRFKDERMARIQASIDARIVGGGASSTSESGGKVAAPVVDILEALRRSLERKPPAQETTAARESGAKKRTKHRKAGA
jgi:DNA end-binding protein Ku